jgi:hypothetical protein
MRDRLSLQVAVWPRICHGQARKVIASLLSLGSGWPGCCARLARRGNARTASGVPSELEDRLVRPDGAA